MSAYEPGNIYHTDALTLLKGLPDESVNCVVTSPPYFGLRDYGVDGQIGQEPTPQEYVTALVEIFREVRRVLRKDGTCWVNVGDSYVGYKGENYNKNGRRGTGEKSHVPRNPLAGTPHTAGLPTKSMMLIPQRLAIALQDDGWIIRNEIVWHKPNPMPSSVEDRFTGAHETVWFMTKSPDYWSDMFAVREPVAEASEKRIKQSNFNNQTGGEKDYGKTGINPSRSARKSLENFAENFDGFRNARDVWTIATEPSPLPHFAPFPTKLVKPCILAGCPETVCAKCGAPHVRELERTAMKIKRSNYGEQSGNRTASSGTMVEPPQQTDLGIRSSCKCDAGTRPGVVLDIFMGTGTTAWTARYHGRDFLGCDLNYEYVQWAKKRLKMPYDVAAIEKPMGDLPMFAALEASS